MHRLKSKKGLIALGAVIALIAAACAVAAWLASSNGQGRFKTGSVLAPVVTADTTFPGAGAVLFPNGDGDVAVKIQNNNANPLLLTSWAMNPGGSLNPSVSGNCSASSFSINTGAAITPAVTIPGGGVTTQYLIKNAVHLAANADNDCQSTEFVSAGATPPFKLNFQTP